MDQPQSKTPGDRDVAAYQRRGFWIGPRLFSGPTIEALRTRCDLDWQLAGDACPSPHVYVEPPPPAPGALRRAFNTFLVNPAIRQVACSAALGRMASALMGVPSVRVWYTQV